MKGFWRRKPSQRHRGEKELIPIGSHVAQKTSLKGYHHDDRIVFPKRHCIRAASLFANVSSFLFNISHQKNIPATTVMMCRALFKPLMVFINPYRC
jgi:hypothetical protein